MPESRLRVGAHQLPVGALQFGTSALRHDFAPFEIALLLFNSICFDALAVMYVTAPGEFQCQVRKGRMDFSAFLAPLGMGRDLEVDDDITGTQMYYCFDLKPQEKAQLVDRFIGRNSRQTTTIYPIPKFAKVWASQKSHGGR